MKDMRGQTFGRLTPIEATKKRKGSAVIWLCQCSCGNMTEVSQSNLASGNNISCGCLKRENGKKLYRLSQHVDGTCIESLENSTLRSDNKTGHIGVSRHKGKFRANITFKGKRYYLGSFETLEEAALIREQAKESLHGRFLEEYYRTQSLNAANCSDGRLLSEQL